ncbi:glycosyltransferase [Actinoplanes sp. GCM10030250]|uniref:glycosyltransferase n=1 Tax=Actinoplanes sp. GCM10030250 TaxID=3273376 RepID=UPI00362306FA
MTPAPMAMASQMIRTVRARRDLAGRRPPRFLTGTDAGGPPRVFYLSPDLDKPSGGVRNIYRHVDVLNGLGIDAAVVHTAGGFRCSWFANDTRVEAAADVRLRPRDVLVTTEWHGPWLHSLPAGVRKIVFNQGPYCTFDATPFEESAAGAPYADLPGLEGLLTVSEDGERLLSWTFPTLPVHRARPVVDRAVFHPGSGPRRRRIGYLARGRRSEEREMLLHMLRARGLPADWELTPISGSEAQVAAAMRECAIFLAFGFREGFGLPPAEAMASGCYVVGYTALGGAEFFDPAYCTPVPECDLRAFGEAIEDAIRRYQEDPDEMEAVALKASATILGRYDVAGLTGDLSSFYSALLPAAA